jgi:hypothetical protein
MGGFLGDMADSWVKDLGYTQVYSGAIANSTSLYCKGTCMREADK